MIRNDYILRLIELLGVFLRRIRKHADSGDLEKIDQEIEKAANEILGIPLGVLESTPAQSLVELFTSRNGQIDALKLMVAGSLLDERGRAAFENGRDEMAFLQGQKAASLLITASDSSDEEIQKTARKRLDSALGYLASFDLPGSMLHELAVHFETIGQFDRAEDFWYSLNQMGESGLDEFYDRMLKLADDQLAAGNLTRDEILEAMRAH